MTPPPRPFRTLAARAALVALALLPATAARAEHQVVFKDWRTLIVRSVEARDDQLVLRLPDEAELVVPAANVVEIRDYVPPPPEPAAPAAEPATPDAAAVPGGGGPGPRWQERAGAFAPAIEKAARKHGLDPALVTAVALAESRLDAWALSRKGAQGVMQLMPGTARDLRVGDVWDAEQNIEAGARWLRRMLEAFGGDLDLALAAYNAGEQAVKKHGGIPPFAETRQYVRKVRDTVDRFVAAERVAAAS